MNPKELRQAGLGLPDLELKVKKTFMQRLNRYIILTSVFGVGTVAGLTGSKVNSLIADVSGFFHDMTPVAVSKLENSLYASDKNDKNLPGDTYSRNIESYSYNTNPSPTITRLASNNHLKYIIHCDKFSNTTRLYEISSGLPQEIYSCRHTDGSGGQGPKQVVGDNKTPEEICQIRRVTYRRTGLSAPLYGDATINLYSGFNGVVLCGTDDPYRQNAIIRKEDVTRSSIVFLNPDIYFIAKRIEPYKDRTRIVIEDMRRPIR